MQANYNRHRAATDATMLLLPPVLDRDSLKGVFDAAERSCLIAFDRLAQRQIYEAIAPGLPMPFNPEKTPLALLPGAGEPMFQVVD
jgi:hypothetical protein